MSRNAHQITFLTFTRRDQLVVLLSIFCQKRGIQWNSEIIGIIQLINPPKGRRQLRTKLKESEGHWQLRLKTIEPFGMNLICEYLELTGEKGLLDTE